MAGRFGWLYDATWNHKRVINRLTCTAEMIVIVMAMTRRTSTLGAILRL